MGFSFDGDRSDVLEKGATYAELTVGTTPVELKVGGSALSGRQIITMQPKDQNIFWGYDNSVTTTTGTEMFKNQLIILPIGHTITVYLVADTANKKVRIGELA